MKKKFEENLEELKSIAEKLEDGSLELAQALSLYDKGMKIIKECEKELGEAESLIKIINLKEKNNEI